MATTTAPVTDAPRVSADLFTAAEAATYLRLPNTRAFNRWRLQVGVSGVRVDREYLYAREQLETIRRRMFGLEQ